MKVYTQTWYRGNNYGSVLQAYALPEVIRSLGYECEVLAYAPTKLEQWRLKILYHGVRATIEYKINERAMKHAKNGDHEVIDNLQVFDEFRKNYMHITAPCSDAASIYRICSEKAIFICGSDQIWNPYNFNPAYFLNFVKDSKRKIAYAPSFGVEVLPNYSKKAIAKEVSTFAAVSVREKRGAELIKDLTGKEVKVAVDPTMLLSMDSWSSLLAERKVEKPYLFCYFLSRNDAYFEAAKEIAQMYNLELKVLPMVAADFAKEETIKEPIGPREWLGLVKNASFVLTDSFHCTLFAIRFHRQFYVLQRFADGDKRGQNSRIKTLLNMTELNDRLLVPNTPVEYGMVTQQKYNIADEKMKGEIDASLQWLRESLHNAAE